MSNDIRYQNWENPIETVYYKICKSSQLADRDKIIV